MRQRQATRERGAVYPAQRGDQREGRRGLGKKDDSGDRQNRQIEEGRGSPPHEIGRYAKSGSVTGDEVVTITPTKGDNYIDADTKKRSTSTRTNHP